MKEKIFKVLHIIGYISIALLILIFTIVGVNSCSNKDIKQSEIEKAPLLTYNIEDDYLYKMGDIVGDYKFNNYDTIYLTKEELFTFTTLFNDNYSNFTHYTQHSFSFKIYGKTQTNSILLNNAGVMNTFNIRYDIQTIIGLVNEGTMEQWRIDFSTLNYDFYFVELILQNGTYPVFDNLFQYIKGGYFRDNNNDEWFGSFKYVLPPYITYDINSLPFKVNLSFQYGEERYYAISYNNGYLRFLGLNGDLLLERKYSLDGNQYIFYSGTEYFNDNRLIITGFGSSGYEWLENNLLNIEEPLYNGVYYFNERYLFDYIHRTELPSSYVVNYPLTFYSNGDFYTNIIINILSMDNTDSVLVHVIYSNNDVKQTSVIYKYFSLSTLQWEQRETDILKKEYYTIELKDSLITEENYSLFRTYYYVEYIKVETGNNGFYIGNVFVLIGDSFSSILPILGISIFPGLTIGVLIFIPLVISLVLFVVWLFKR